MQIANRRKGSSIVELVIAIVMFGVPVVIGVIGVIAVLRIVQKHPHSCTPMTNRGLSSENLGCGEMEQFVLFNTKGSGVVVARVGFKGKEWKYDVVLTSPSTKVAGDPVCVYRTAYLNDGTKSSYIFSDRPLR